MTPTHFRRASSVSLLALLLVGAGGCASAPVVAPSAPAFSVEVLSEPTGASIRRAQEDLGSAPARLGLDSMSEVLALRAEQPDLRLIERRIRVLGAGELEVLFRFGTEPTDLAQALGLGQVTVFDYAGAALFDVDRSELRAEARPLIEQQAALLRGPFDGIPVFACGHTDSTGGEEHNLELSLSRAQAIADVLVSEGVESSRILVQGFGLAFPVAINDTEEGRALNRRAEIVLPDELD